MKYLKLILACSLLLGCSRKEEKPNNKEEIKIEENRVTFNAVGDNLIHQLLIDRAYKEGVYDFSSYYSNIQSYIKKADISFVNQETVLGGKELGYSGYPNFNTPSEMAQTLQDIGFDVVNGATNHSFDKGEQGLNNSIDLFDQYDMKYIGLYKSQEDRDSIEVIEKNGIKIAFLSYNQLTNGHSVPHSYSYNPFDENLIKEDIENAKEISDFVVVSAHWGNEYETTQNSFQNKYAKIIADAGADVIIGTHSHTLQPVEWIEGKDGNKTLVAYSLGNFISGMMEEITQLGAMISLDFVKKENELFIENVVLTPLANHYTVDSLGDAYGTRDNFTVYRLKDYTEEMSSKHGLNGYNGITISASQMKEKVDSIIDDSIKIDY